MKNGEKNGTCGNFLLCPVLFLYLMSVNENSLFPMSNQGIKTLWLVCFFFLFLLKLRISFYQLSQQVFSWEM